MSLLCIPYAYIWIGLFIILAPLCISVLVQKNILVVLVSTGIYFFFLALTTEITALGLHQWGFNGVEYIGYVTLLGQTFPFEEFLFYILLSGAGGVSYCNLLISSKEAR